MAKPLPLHPQQNAALQCLAYLTRVSNDLNKTLPDSAKEPTANECQTAIDGLRNYVLTHPPGVGAPPASLASENATPEGVDPDTGF